MQIQVHFYIYLIRMGFIILFDTVYTYIIVEVLLIYWTANIIFLLLLNSGKYLLVHTPGD